MTGYQITIETTDRSAEHFLDAGTNKRTAIRQARELAKATVMEDVIWVGVDADHMGIASFKTRFHPDEARA